MFLGIDLGTSEVKLVLLDDAHRIHASVGEALSVQRPQPLWSEQCPRDWWAATGKAAQRLRDEHGAAWRQVRAIGLSGQMHGAVLLDAAGDVLRPAILWNDGRSGAQCAQLEAALPSLHDITANLAMPGFTAPKLLWVREHEPELFARTAKVLLPKDWLRWQLTGEHFSDMSDASGTLWLDVARRDWSDEVLAACGLNRSHMPTLVEGSQVGGTLAPAVAQAWGLPAGIPVAGGGGDNAASAVGIGATRPGEGFVSLGTSGVIFLAGDALRPNPAHAVHAFCHALPGRWHQMSVMLSAAACLAWARKLLGAVSEADLMARAEALTAQQRARAPLFLPYLSGERTPHNNPLARGVFFGLDHEHDAATLAWSVVEGVSFGLADGWQALGAAPGSVASLTLVGGGSRSALWAQLLANTLGVPLCTVSGGEAGGALGAARLAWMALGGSEAEVCVRPALARSFVPDATAAASLAPRLARFRQLYRTLADEFTAPPDQPGA